MSTMSQLGKFLATIQNQQDARTAALEERLAQLESKGECGCAETITALEERLATLEAQGECECGSYEELLDSYGERIADLESSVGTGSTGGSVLPASIGYNKTGFVRNSIDSYNRTVEICVNNPAIGATYSLAGTAEAVTPITYDGTAEVRWNVQTPGDTGTVTLSQTIGDTSTEIGTVALTAVESDPLLKDEIDKAGKTPIEVCRGRGAVGGGRILMNVQTFNPANPVVRIEWRQSAEGLLNNANVNGSTDIAGNNINDEGESCLICYPLDSGYITAIGYDAYGNRTPEVTYEIAPKMMTILVHKVEDGDNYKFYFALLNCSDEIFVMLETKQPEDEYWSNFDLSTEYLQGTTITLPKSMFDSTTLWQVFVANNTTGCISDALPLTADMSSAVIYA